MKVQVYYNSHKKLWSVRHKNRVILHLKNVILKDAKFHVSEAGRQRVIKTKRKNVHAWVEGAVCDEELDLNGLHNVTYNPYKQKTFEINNQPVTKARYVVFFDKGVIALQ